MEYQKNKLMLNEIRALISWLNLGLVLIYMLKAYHKKCALILLRKYMFNSLLGLFFWKECTFH